MRGGAGVKAGTIKAGYVIIKIDGKLYNASRLIWMYVHGEDPGELQIDHINRIKNDDRIENLRTVTHQQNHWNRSSDKNSSSKYPGVSWNQFHKKWLSRIGVDGKEIYLGLYDTEEEAHEVRQAAKEKYHAFV